MLHACDGLSFADLSQDCAVPQQLDTCDLIILSAVSLAFITSTVVWNAISVDAPNIVTVGGAVGKAPRESRSGLHVLEEDMYTLLLELSLIHI